MYTALLDILAILDLSYDAAVGERRFHENEEHAANATDRTIISRCLHFAQGMVVERKIAWKHIKNVRDNLEGIRRPLHPTADDNLNYAGSQHNLL